MYERCNGDSVNTSLAISLSLRIKLRQSFGPLTLRITLAHCERCTNITNCARFPHALRIYSFNLRIHLGKDSSRRTRVKRRDCCVEAVCGHICRSHTLYHALISVNMDTGSQILAWWQITETVNVIIFVTAKTSNLHCFRADWKTTIEVCLQIPYANYNLYWPHEWFYYSARYIFRTLLLAKNNNFFCLKKN